MESNQCRILNFDLSTDGAKQPKITRNFVLNKNSFQEKNCLVWRSFYRKFLGKIQKLIPVVFKVADQFPKNSLYDNSRVNRSSTKFLSLIAIWKLRHNSLETYGARSAQNRRTFLAKNSGTVNVQKLNFPYPPTLLTRIISTTNLPQLFTPLAATLAKSLGRYLDLACQTTHYPFEFSQDLATREVDSIDSYSPLVHASTTYNYANSRPFYPFLSIWDMIWGHSCFVRKSHKIDKIWTKFFQQKPEINFFQNPSLNSLGNLPELINPDGTLTPKVLEAEDKVFAIPEFRNISILATSSIKQVPYPKRVQSVQRMYQVQYPFGVQINRILWAWLFSDSRWSQLINQKKQNSLNPLIQKLGISSPFFQTFDQITKNAFLRTPPNFGDFRKVNVKNAFTTSSKTTFTSLKKHDFAMSSGQEKINSNSNDKVTLAKQSIDEKVLTPYYPMSKKKVPLWQFLTPLAASQAKPLRGLRSSAGHAMLEAEKKRNFLEYFTLLHRLPFGYLACSELLNIFATHSFESQQLGMSGGLVGVGGKLRKNNLFGVRIRGGISETSGLPSILSIPPSLPSSLGHGKLFKGKHSTWFNGSKLLLHEKQPKRLIQLYTLSSSLNKDHTIMESFLKENSMCMWKKMLVLLTKKQVSTFFNPNQINLRLPKFSLHSLKPTLSSLLTKYRKNSITILLTLSINRVPYSVSKDNQRNLSLRKELSADTRRSTHLIESIKNFRDFHNLNNSVKQRRLWEGINPLGKRSSQKRVKMPMLSVPQRGIELCLSGTQRGTELGLSSPHAQLLTPLVSKPQRGLARGGELALSSPRRGEELALSTKSIESRESRESRDIYTNSPAALALGAKERSTYALSSKNIFKRLQRSRQQIWKNRYPYTVRKYTTFESSDSAVSNINMTSGVLGGISRFRFKLFTEEPELCSSSFRRGETRPAYALSSSSSVKQTVGSYTAQTEIQALERKSSINSSNFYSFSNWRSKTLASNALTHGQLSKPAVSNSKGVNDQGPAKLKKRLAGAMGEERLVKQKVSDKQNLSKKYNKFHTWPIFSTFIYKEWSHRFCFLEYFIWSARQDDLALPFYTGQGTQHMVRRNSLNLLKNKLVLKKTSKNLPFNLNRCNNNVSISVPSIDKYATDGQIISLSASSGFGKGQRHRGVEKKVAFIRNHAQRKDQITTSFFINPLGIKNSQRALTPSELEAESAAQLLTPKKLSTYAVRSVPQRGNELGLSSPRRGEKSIESKPYSLGLAKQSKGLNGFDMFSDRLAELKNIGGNLLASNTYPQLSVTVPSPKNEIPPFLKLREQKAYLIFDVESDIPTKQCSIFTKIKENFSVFTPTGLETPFIDQVDRVNKLRSSPEKFSTDSIDLVDKRSSSIDSFGVRSFDTKGVRVSKTWEAAGNQSLEKKVLLFDGKIDDTQQFPRLAELLHFTGGTALRHLLGRFHLILLGKFLRHELKHLELKVNLLLALKMLTYSQGLLLGKLAKRRSKQIRRLKLLELFQSQKSNPEWMILSVLPVLPPDLRPILRVNDDFVVASDLNRLYQTVLRRNNTIHERLDDPLPCPESGLFRQRSLQKAVDGLLENGKGGGTPLCASKRRPLVSLSHVLKGKKGLFRQHLLGKRVDYSGRSVIVVGPKLSLHECGLPKEMAMELFQPFLIHRLKVKGLATSNTSAKRLIQQEDPIIWHLVKQLVYEHPVLLNRAPTLHRLGIQAFQPRLVSGRAILLHPLVCNGFNADFDGDQMAVHVPLSFQARAEAWKIMWSKNNLLSPATGQPILVPSQDMVLGCYYLSVFVPRVLQYKWRFYPEGLAQQHVVDERSTYAKRSIPQRDTELGFSSPHSQLLTPLVSKPQRGLARGEKLDLSSPRRGEELALSTKSIELIEKLSKNISCVSEVADLVNSSKLVNVFNSLDSVERSAYALSSLAALAHAQLRKPLLSFASPPGSRLAWDKKRPAYALSSLGKELPCGHAASYSAAQDIEQLRSMKYLSLLSSFTSPLQFYDNIYTNKIPKHLVGVVETSTDSIKNTGNKDTKEPSLSVPQKGNKSIETNDLLNNQVLSLQDEQLSCPSEATLSSANQTPDSVAAKGVKSKIGGKHGMPKSIGGHYFTSLQDSLLAYFQGRLETHTLFWVRIDLLRNQPQEFREGKIKSINSMVLNTNNQKSDKTSFYKPSTKDSNKKNHTFALSFAKLPQAQLPKPSDPTSSRSFSKTAHAMLIQQFRMPKGLVGALTPKVLEAESRLKKTSFAKEKSGGVGTSSITQKEIKGLVAYTASQDHSREVLNNFSKFARFQLQHGLGRELCKILFKKNHYNIVIEANDALEAPLEIRISADGNLVKVLTTFQNHYHCSATVLDQCKEKSIQYMRTTVGRVVINESLFQL